MAAVGEATAGGLGPAALTGAQGGGEGGGATGEVLMMRQDSTQEVLVDSNARAEERASKSASR